MLPTVVVGVIHVGVDGRSVRSAKPRVPFLARFIGQGVVSGDANPWIVRCNVAVPVPHAFEQLWVTVHCPGLVGVPWISPVPVFRVNPSGRKFTPKLVGLWFVLNKREH
jgi:hypothetical protein